MSKDKPLVSVVIATYNMAEYLLVAVRSALDQTYRTIEILIVDDGSTDGTRDAVEPLLEDRRVRYFHQQNHGQAAAKNHGVRESHGEYVAFLDADDMWEPEKLELQMPLFLGSARIGVVYSRLAYIDESGAEVRVADNELFRGRVTGPLLIRNFIGFGSSVVRKACFDQLGAFDDAIGMGIDYDLWLRFSTEYEFDFVDRPLLRYRVWSGQMSNNCKSRYLSGIAIMHRFLERFPNLVDKGTEREAWAHTYVGYGQCLRQVERRVAPALRSYFQALLHRPTYLPAWRAITTTILGLK
jgi:glycosyltransferase involved in cell wall biosynthesis